MKFAGLFLVEIKILLIQLLEYTGYVWFLVSSFAVCWKVKTWRQVALIACCRYRPVIFLSTLDFLVEFFLKLKIGCFNCLVKFFIQCEMVFAVTFAYLKVFSVTSAFICFRNFFINIYPLSKTAWQSNWSQQYCWAGKINYRVYFHFSQLWSADKGFFSF